MAGKRARNRASQPPSATATAAWKMQQTNLPEDLLLLTKDQLKSECRKRGQKTTGNKAELLQRLGHKMVNQSAKRKETAAPQSTVAAAAAAGVNKTNTANGNNVTQKEPRVVSQTTTSNAYKQMEKAERETIVLWRRPFTTLEYFTKETLILLFIYGQKLLQCRKVVCLLLISVVGLTSLFKLAGPHQPMVQLFYKKIAWCVYWCGLGILSSVGLGTGLHTFLLYLGPHIAAVTIAAYECNSLNFPEPPYPDDIICPTTDSGSVLITMFAIMSKVRVEAMCWGAGTALGELPPYFMARAARLSGYDPDDDGELKEFEELQRKQRNREDLTLLEKAKLGVEKMVERVGFFGILACASIPNPLFDLAGITCGHFLVPFWTFFGATLIGKAIIKMHIQKLFVIIAFNETLIENAVVLLGLVPVVGSKLQEPFKEFLANQKNRLHRKSAEGPSHDAGGGSILSSIFEKFVFVMIFYFVISIINSLAQSYHKRNLQCNRKGGGAYNVKLATD